MTIRPQPLADVTYRATVAGNREAELRLRMPLAAASAADGWARLSAVFAEVDPMTMEIEIREIVETPALAPRRQAAPVVHHPCTPRSQAKILRFRRPRRAAGRAVVEPRFA